MSARRVPPRRRPGGPRSAPAYAAPGRRHARVTRGRTAQRLVVRGRRPVRDPRARRSRGPPGTPNHRRRDDPRTTGRGASP